MNPPDADGTDSRADGAERAAARPAPRRRSGGALMALLAVFGVLLVAGAGAAFYYYTAGQAPAVMPEPAGSSAAAEPDAPTKPMVAESAGAPTGAAADTPAQPAQAGKLSAERFDGWFVVCPDGQPGAPTCFIQQQLHSAQSNALVFMWIMRRDEAGVIHSVWQTPPGLEIARGMVLDVGDGTPRQVPVANCQPTACTVRGVFAPAYLDTLVAASRITVTITLRADGRALRYGFEPKGMAAALARLAGDAPVPAPGT